jgi:hypothetical protein
MFANQSNTPSLLHPPELQVPLFLQPFGVPPPELHEEHPIVFLFCVKNTDFIASQYACLNGLTTPDCELNRVLKQQIIFPQPSIIHRIKYIAQNFNN